jgi:hypothetical protein
MRRIGDARPLCRLHHCSRHLLPRSQVPSVKALLSSDGLKTPAPVAIPSAPQLRCGPLTASSWWRTSQENILRMIANNAHSNSVKSQHITPLFRHIGAVVSIRNMQYIFKYLNTKSCVKRRDAGHTK